MPQARLTLTIPESVWIGELSRSYPDATIRVLAALSRDETGVGLVEVHHPDVSAVIADLRAYDAVAEVELLQLEDEEAILQFETAAPLLLLPMQETGIPLQTPFSIVDGNADWELTAPHERLSALTDQFEAFGIPFEVRWIQQTADSEALLTENQHELVNEALERGYYDSPRTCTLTELADELGLAASTCSETLHHAEEKIVKEFVGDDGSGESRTLDG